MWYSICGEFFTYLYMALFAKVKEILLKSPWSALFSTYFCIFNGESVHL